MIFTKKSYNRVPTVLQMEAVECGAASLTMILAYYKCFVPLEEIREACGVSRDGSKASNILRAARSYGLEATGYRKSIEDIMDLDQPVIIHWNLYHFIVLEGFSKKGAHINDPGMGRRVVSLKEFGESYTGIVLLFSLTDKFVPSGNKTSGLKGVFSRLKLSKSIFWFILLSGLVLVVPGLIIPAFSRVFLDEILINNRIDWLPLLLFGMLFTAIFRAILMWIREEFFVELESKLSIIFSATFFWHILRVPARFFTQRDAGDISYRMQSNQKISNLIANKLAPMILHLLCIIFYLIFLYKYDSRLTIVIIISALLSVAYLVYVSSNRKEMSARFVRDFGKLNAISMNGIKMIETIKATGSENQFFERWAGYHAKASDGEQKMGLSTQMLSTLPMLLTQVTQILVLAIGAIEVANGRMTVGTLVAFQTLMISFNIELLDIVEVSIGYQEIYGDLKRVDDVCNYQLEEEIVASDVEDKSNRIMLLSGAIDVDSISFGYSPLEAPIIEGFSLNIKKGQRVAFVGGSGSGKSTIGRLISGLYKPWNGDILFDNKKRIDIDRLSICDALATVDQEICLFSGSILDNIRLWDENISIEDVIESAKDACIHDVITKKNNGYNHILEERGANLSGGQRQRIEIARALAKKPKILILDEATSALDPKTEQIIMENIKRRGCTCIIIAHRLSSIRDCDEIIVMNKGRVTQRGTHSYLMSEKGYYSELIKSTS